MWDFSQDLLEILIAHHVNPFSDLQITLLVGRKSFILLTNEWFIAKRCLILEQKMSFPKIFCFHISSKNMSEKSCQHLVDEVTLSGKPSGQLGVQKINLKLHLSKPLI